MKRACCNVTRTRLLLLRVGVDFVDFVVVVARTTNSRLSAGRVLARPVLNLQVYK